MKIQILAIGRHEEIMETLLRLINKNDNWQGTGTLDDNKAMQLFDDHEFDIVLLSSGITEDCEKKLCSYFKHKKPSMIIIQHYGGGSGLLTNEILQALQ